MKIADADMAYQKKYGSRHHSRHGIAILNKVWNIDEKIMNLTAPKAKRRASKRRK